MQIPSEVILASEPSYSNLNLSRQICQPNKSTRLVHLPFNASTERAQRRRRPGKPRFMCIEMIRVRVVGACRAQIHGNLSPE